MKSFQFAVLFRLFFKREVRGIASQAGANTVLWHGKQYGPGAANQMCGGGGWYRREDVYADILHHRQLPRRICTNSVSYYHFRT